MTIPVSEAIQHRLEALSKSEFRSGIGLNKRDLLYLNRHESSQIFEHAVRFLSERLADANPKNDGKQTPWRGHPVFVAQHATATCCRGCMAKWHNIAKGRTLSDEELQFAASLISSWLEVRRTQSDINDLPLFADLTEEPSSD